ncbi:MAG TPA: EamA family transporter, partial [Gaiellaceae bacterium]|nr:EamA family transporter [Gaiellaceae bacterium]
TYAYVNPVVAIALGAIVLHESLTWTTAAGAALVLACVALVVRRESIPPEAEAVGAGAADLAAPGLTQDAQPVAVREL